MIPIELRPFDDDSCCFNSPSSLQSKIAEYYTSVKPYMNEILEGVFVSEMYGKDPYCFYTNGNKFHYLLSLLIMIEIERRNDALWNYAYGTGIPQDKGLDYYLDKYNIEEVKKTFSSTGSGYDISEALDSFGLNPDAKAQDGIGYMSIEYSAPLEAELDVKPFIVR